MPSDQSSPAYARIVPESTIDQVGAALQVTAQAIGREAITLTEQQLPPNTWHQPRFVLAIGQGFCGLLLGELLPNPANSYRIELHFAPSRILQFVADLVQQYGSEAPWAKQLQHLSQICGPNDANWQSQFSLTLVDILSQAVQPDLAILEQGAEAFNGCAIVEATLRQQVQQEQLLNQVVTQIRQSFELPVILDTAMQQVRQFLQADRLLIYQFEADPVVSEHRDISRGHITHEALAHPGITSALQVMAEDPCFIRLPGCREKYRKGAILAANDVAVTYADTPCLSEWLQQIQVKSKLVVPIVVQGTLWGLLIAHQCDRGRIWQDSETTFLLRIAEHLSIAIHQTHLYNQLQRQAETLSKQVVERTQELRDALEVAQSASLAKTEFFAAISHELRTPLTCIIGMATTLLRLPPGEAGERFIPPAKQRDYLKTIHKSGEHLLELINDILDLSQVEAGRTVLDVRQFSLSQLASGTIRMLKNRAEEQGIKLDLRLKLKPKDAQQGFAAVDRFIADPRRVRQILLNLISNAIKFTPGGGRVTLRIWREQENAIFQVEDTGIGIPDHQRHLLFRKFQQLDSSYQRRYEGTGLGLALTKQLVELHGGWIEVESIVDVGSVFTVWLPPQSLAMDVGPGGPLVPDYGTQFPLGRIFLVHRDEEAATLICDLLTTAGYQVVWSVDAALLMHQMDVLKPKAILLEAHQFNLHGWEIVRTLRQHTATPPIKLLLLGKPSDPPLPLEADPADDYLLEPIAHPEMLLDKLAALIMPSSSS